MDRLREKEQEQKFTSVSKKSREWKPVETIVGLPLSLWDLLTGGEDVREEAEDQRQTKRPHTHRKAG